MSRYLDPELHELVNQLRSELELQVRLVSHLRSELAQQNAEMCELQAENKQLRDSHLDLLRTIRLAHDKISLAVENIQNSLGV